MAKRNFWIGMLVMVLVFGITVVGCDDGSTSKGTNMLTTANFSTGTPSPAALAAGGFANQTEFNQVRDAAAGGFYGWAMEEGDLIMAWTGRSAANYNSVANALIALFGGINLGDTGEGFYMAMGTNYMLMFFTQDYSVYEGYYFPAGSIVAYFGDSGDIYGSQKNIPPLKWWAGR